MTTLDIQRHVPLAPLTTLELGGPANHFVRADEESTLSRALSAGLRMKGMAAAVLGGGSNLIVPDEGYDGLVIHMGIDNLEFGNAGHSGPRVQACPGKPSSAARCRATGPASSA